MKETCKTCKAWQKGGCEDEGQCRRHSPLLISDQNMNQGRRLWPLTYDEDWCLDYVAK